jgi:hypothetical protein
MFKHKVRYRSGRTTFGARFAAVAAVFFAMGVAAVSIPSAMGIDLTEQRQAGQIARESFLRTWAGMTAEQRRIYEAIENQECKFFLQHQAAIPPTDGNVARMMRVTGAAASYRHQVEGWMQTQSPITGSASTSPRKRELNNLVQQAVADIGDKTGSLLAVNDDNVGYLALTAGARPAESASVAVALAQGVHDQKWRFHTRSFDEMFRTPGIPRKPAGEITFDLSRLTSGEQQKVQAILSDLRTDPGFQP